MKFELYLNGFDLENTDTWHNRQIVEAENVETVQKHCNENNILDFQQVDTDQEPQLILN